MDVTRRYRAREARQILDLAIGADENPARALHPTEGLTLGELQAVGAEVGLDPERVAVAVAAFERNSEPVTRQTLLGLPTTVQRVVPLARAPDHEWELLIGELRTTFGGAGVATTSGGLREWSNGATHVFLEPTESGHRLRLESSNGLSVLGVAAGVLLFGLAPGARFIVPFFFSIAAGGLAGGGVWVGPRWVNERARGMGHISERAALLLARAPAQHGHG